MHPMYSPVGRQDGVRQEDRRSRQLPRPGYVFGLGMGFATVSALRVAVFQKDGDGMTDTEPLYPCGNEDCAAEVSYHASELRLHPDGDLICLECWDEETTDTDPRWHDLPEFISHKTELAEARAECERLHKLAYSPHMKDGKPRSWFSVVGDYNARASDEEDRADKAEATRDTAIAVHNAMETQMHTAEANLLSMRAERDELAAQVFALKAMWDTRPSQTISLSDLPARARQIMEALDAGENLMIAVGMGWDLEGIMEVAKEKYLAYQQEPSND